MKVIVEIPYIPEKASKVIEYFLEKEKEFEGVEFELHLRRGGSAMPRVEMWANNQKAER